MNLNKLVIISLLLISQIFSQADSTANPNPYPHFEEYTGEWVISKMLDSYMGSMSKEQFKKIKNQILVITPDSIVTTEFTMKRNKLVIKEYDEESFFEAARMSLKTFGAQVHNIFFVEVMGIISTSKDRFWHSGKKRSAFFVIPRKGQLIYSYNGDFFLLKKKDSK